MLTVNTLQRFFRNLCNLSPLPAARVDIKVTPAQSIFHPLVNSEEKILIPKTALGVLEWCVCQVTTI